jgi:hypothetical protein
VRGTHFLKSADKGSSQERSRPSERRALTSWRAQTRRRAKSGCRYKTTPARGTHFLESADQTEGEVRTQIQNHACEGYSLPGERRPDGGRSQDADTKPRLRGVLTLWRVWRAQTENRDAETNRGSEAHSLTEEHRRREHVKARK